MTRKRTVATIAMGAAVAVVLTACGGGNTSTNPSSTNGGGSGAAPVFNAGVDHIANPSDRKGGTLRMAHSDDFDSVDPQDMYYAAAWDFVRFYGRSLMMNKIAPGKTGAELVPDLAEAPGVSSEDLKTWTYKLRKGIKFEDGTPITSKDVKYGVERSLDKDTFPQGPTYLNDFLDTQGYTSPYKDSSPDKLGLKAVETPDDQTIIFHLAKPYAAFDYFAMLPSVVPVPQAKDTGVKYKEHPVSSGPYMFEKHDLGKSITLVRNPNWDPATDPIRKALPDRIELALKANGEDIDNRLMNGQLEVDAEGNGVEQAAQSKILNDPKLKAQTDSAPVLRTWFTSINPDVITDVHCRRALEYAVDRDGYQRAYGGSIGGDIATNMAPANLPGAEKFDLYPNAPDNKGNVAKAKEELAACNKPGGYETTLIYRNGRDREQKTAESMKAAFEKAGIKVTLKGFPAGDYFKLYAGKPSWLKENNVGIMVYGWGADYAEGFGFWDQIVDSRVIRTAGNTNLGVKDPAIDALIDQTTTTKDTTARNKLYVEIDKKAMEGAYFIPGVSAKGLFYRPQDVTNAFVSDGFQMQDFLAMGLAK
jgi:peptide/nickel transport system substrate-binding protein